MKTRRGSKGRAKRKRSTHPLLRSAPSFPPPMAQPFRLDLGKRIGEHDEWEGVMSKYLLGPEVPRPDFELNTDAQIVFPPALQHLCGRPLVCSRRRLGPNSYVVFHTQGVFFFPVGRLTNSTKCRSPFSPWSSAGNITSGLAVSGPLSHSVRGERDSRAS